MYKWVLYNNELIVFHGDALLDPSTQRICIMLGPMRESRAKYMCELLNLFAPESGAFCF